jgi:alpha-amylase/alpha-mannosidase (GH57 family)
MTKVAVLWHMHQPYYEDRRTGEHVLPWVRLHALKDYFGMIALTEQFPDLRVTFNLVPSLLVQLEAFAADRARDRHLELGLKPAVHLTSDERAFLVSHFFHAHPVRMIEPYPRYRELFGKKAEGPAAYSDEDLRDLQIWHKLVWIDRSYLERDPRCLALIERGARFDEEDKAALRAIELEILNRVIPEYRRAAGRGQVELSTSPFYHPILPLLCDSHIYLQTHPQSPMPRHRFVHPEDAREQIARAVAYHERLFGQRPRGLWPSEGSVSEAVADLAVDAGFDWIATDELILARMLDGTWTRDGGGHVDRPERLYRPYRVGKGPGIACGFRDHSLSDLIGFTYAGWEADRAAEDLCDRLRTAGHRFAARAPGEEAVVFIILDGENAWEHYAASGRPFLEALYRRLTTDRELTPVTMADACRSATTRLGELAAGSWIEGNFSIWMGHRDDRRAWDQLADARARLDAAAPSEPSTAQACEELFIAEGSDWFWWYGDDHSSEHDLVFDDLFRRHLRNAYEALGEPIPSDLFATNITTRPTDAPWSPPVSFLAPIVDGESTSYFEWLGAGLFEPHAGAGAMHQASARTGGRVRFIHLGFDPDVLYVRIDLAQRADQALAHGLGVSLTWLQPAGYRLHLGKQKGRLAVTLSGSNGDLAAPEIQAEAGAILELSVPFACLGAGQGDTVAFVVSLGTSNGEVERHPSFTPFAVIVPGPDFERLHWTA